MAGTQGRNLEAGIDTSHGETLLSSLFSGLLSLLSHTTQDHQPRVNNVHSGLGPLTSIINQENII